MRIVSVALLCTLVLATFVSCQKEKSFEIPAPAVGSLKSDVSGDCLPKNVVGAFIAGSALTDSNYLEVDVDVAAAGAYQIRTDTINGYSFSALGSFDHTGINRIRLAAVGTPRTAGQDAFTVIYDTSFCFVPVTVLAAGSTSGPAEFTLQGAGDSCMVSNVSGTYSQNVPLGSSNTVAIRINASKPGTYNISTNSVNDIQFSGTGTIATTGEQTITLTGSGTPTTEGSTVFTVTAGGTTCTFSVTVAASTTPPPVGTGDLFPLSTNSWWSYVPEEGVTDSITVTNTGPVSFEGKDYSKFEYVNQGNVIDQGYYRKESDTYYEYADVTKYSLVELDDEQKGELPFLKENLTVGQQWQSADFTGNSGGTPVVLHYVFTCESINGTEVINGQTLTGVTKITFTAMAGPAGSLQDVGAHVTMYFAKGIGLVKQHAEEFSDADLFLKGYKVL